MSARCCPGCGAGLERLVQGSRSEAGLLCSFVASCPDCGWTEAACAPGLVPPPWRDRALAEQRTGLWIGRVDPAALSRALRLALGLPAGQATRWAAASPGWITAGLPIEMEWLRDALAARGLPCRAAPVGPGPAELSLRRSAAGRALALVGPPGAGAPVRSLRAKAVLRGFVEAGGRGVSSEDPDAAGALRFGAAADLGVPLPPRRRGGLPRALIDAQGGIVDVAGLGAPGGAAEAALFDAAVEGLPELGRPVVIGLDGHDRGPWALSLEACAGMAPARVVEALLSGEAGVTS